MGQGAWAVLIFLINAFVFMAIGLQLPGILDGLSAYSATELIGLGVAVSLTTIVARIVWVFPATYIPRRLSAKIRASDPYPPPRSVFIVSWAGMRGAVSLAAALALPIDFPERQLLLFLTFCVIVATLIGQGLSLPWLIRHLGVVASTSGESEEAHARLAAMEAAQRRLDGLENDYPDHKELIDQLRAQYDHDASHVWPHGGEAPDASEQALLDHRAIRSAVLLAEREAVIALRDAAVINDETLRRIERDLDLDALRAGA